MAPHRTKVRRESVAQTSPTRLFSVGGHSAHKSKPSWSRWRTWTCFTGTMQIVLAPTSSSWTRRIVRFKMPNTPSNRTTQHRSNTASLRGTSREGGRVQRLKVCKVRCIKAPLQALTTLTIIAAIAMFKQIKAVVQSWTRLPKSNRIAATRQHQSQRIVQERRRIAVKMVSVVRMTRKDRFLSRLAKPRTR